MREIAQEPPGLRFHFETVPADVREDRNFQRQRTPAAGERFSAMAGKTLPALVPGKAYAGSGSAADIVCATGTVSCVVGRELGCFWYSCPRIAIPGDCRIKSSSTLGFTKFDF